MAILETPRSGGMRELSLDEGREFFDRRARYYLGISGDEFLARWRRGEYRDGSPSKVMYVIAALPFVRES